MTYFSPIIILYILNLESTICQLCINQNKTGSVKAVGNQVRASDQTKGVVWTPKTPHTADCYLCKFQALKLDTVLCCPGLSITNVVKPALVVLTMMARYFLAIITTRKLWNKIKVYYLQELKLHSTLSRTVRLRLEERMQKLGVLLLGSRAGARPLFCLLFIWWS